MRTSIFVLALGAALVVSPLGATAPAQAESLVLVQSWNHDGDGQRWRDSRWRHRHYWHRPYYRPAPPVVYYPAYRPYYVPPPPPRPGVGIWIR